MALKIMDPSDVLTWFHDWTDFLSSGDTIASRLWTVDPDPSPSRLSNVETAVVTFSNPSWGTRYRLSERVTTANGETAERSLTIVCGHV